jgi:hypothetical protein
MRYTFSINMRLQGYTDSDWEGSTVDKKRTDGSCFALGSSMVSLCNRKQTCVALSTAKAKYTALSVAVHEAVWLCKLLADLFGHVLDSIVIPRHGAEEGSTGVVPSYI